MTARSRPTLRRRLVLGLGSSIALLFGTGVVGTAMLRRAHGGLQASVRDVVDVKTKVFASQDATRQYVLLAQHDLLRGEDAQTARMDSASATADSLRHLLAVGDVITEGERARLARIGTLQGRIGTRLAVARSYQDVRDAPAALAQVALTSALLDSLFAESAAIIAAEDGRAAAMVARADALVARQQSLVYALLALGLAAALGAGVLTLRAVTRPLARLARAAHRVGEGDLRAEVELDASGLDEEYRVVAAALTETTRRLAGLVREIQREASATTEAAAALTAASGETAAATGEVSGAMAQIVGVAERQLEAVRASRAVLTQVSSAADAMDGTAREARALEGDVERLTTEARAGVSEAMETLGKARDVIGASAASVERLEGAVTHVVDFLTLTQRIAQQTNLLALNAAIEAARAGEHGKGFAVVASEIRKLADESRRASDEARSVLTTMHDEVVNAARSFRDGVRSLGDVDATSRTVTDALAAIQQAVGRIDTLTVAVASAAESSRASALEMSERLAAAAEHAEAQTLASGEASAGAEETAAASQEVAATAAHLAESAERMRELTAAFVLDDGETRELAAVPEPAAAPVAVLVAVPDTVPTAAAELPAPYRRPRSRRAERATT
ncbi:MAG: methyl-accepting chemotaxis protein [Gemmatimonadaceae bacterium]